MPLRWEILHAERRVNITADGPVSPKEMEQLFDAIVVADAMPYGKLFDATRLVSAYDEDDLLRMGARLSAYASTLPIGPIAFVGETESAETVFQRFITMSPSGRPARLFATRGAAETWLAQMAGHVTGKRS